MQKFQIWIPEPDLHCQHLYTSIISKVSKKEWFQLFIFALEEHTGYAVSAFLLTQLSIRWSGLWLVLWTKVQLCGRTIICCSWADKSGINNSICFLFVGSDKYTRNNIICNMYFFIFFPSAFLLQTPASQISSELSGSPPTAGPSIPPKQRNNSLQDSPNLKYKLIFLGCVWDLLMGNLLSHRERI